MKVSKDIISGWPGYRLTAGGLSIGIVPDIGGRIMSLVFRGEELLYVHASEAGKIHDFSHVADLRTFKKEFGFRIFGGDKTWVAPEKDWWDKIPPLEIDAGRYTFEVKDNFVIMVSPVCRETGLQITRRVSLAEDGAIHLEEEFHNTTEREIVKGIWNVTQIKKPFDVYVPAALGDVRSYYLEDATLPEFGLVPQEKNGWVIIPCRGKVCYKIGAMLREGRSVVVKDASFARVSWARSFDIDFARPYAHRSIIEVFNSPQYDYGEFEVHSPLYRIAPGARVSLRQCWQLAEGFGKFF